MKIKTFANKLLMGLAYIPVTIQYIILIIGLGFLIYENWRTALNIIVIILGIILLLSLVWLIREIKEYIRFKKGKYSPVIIDAGRFWQPDPKPIPLEEMYDFNIRMGIRSQQYISDLTIKGKMSVKSMKHILKMKNLSRLNLKDVKFTDCQDKNILEDIFRELKKLEILILPSSEYWGIEKRQD